MGMADDNGFHLVSLVKLIVYLVKDSEILYSRKIRHSTERTWTNTLNEVEALPPVPLVKQEHLDGLIRLAMEDFMKRLK